MSNRWTRSRSQRELYEKGCFPWYEPSKALGQLSTDDMLKDLNKNMRYITSKLIKDSPVAIILVAKVLEKNAEIQRDNWVLKIFASFPLVCACAKNHSTPLPVTKAAFRFSKTNTCQEDIYSVLQASTWLGVRRSRMRTRRYSIDKSVDWFTWFSDSEDAYSRQWHLQVEFVACRWGCGRTT